MKRTILINLMIFIVMTCQGQNWSALLNGVSSSPGHGVMALCNDTNNNLLYVGGQFQSASGVPANFIASWDGLNWDSLGSGMNGNVNALEMYNGELFAGGAFNYAGGNPILNFSKWDGVHWSTVSNLITSSVRILKNHNGLLYGVTTTSQIFTWDGNNLVFLDSPNGNVYAMEFFNNDLIVGGSFNTAGTAIVNNIAKWDGSSWSALGSGVNGYIHTLKSYNGNLYAGGSFYYVGALQANDIAKWDGASWSALGLGIGNCGNGDPVFAIIGFNNIIYAGGNFGCAGGQYEAYIAQWDGLNWSSMNTGMNTSIETFEIFHNDLIAGGEFTVAGGVTVNNIAKWDLINSMTNHNIISNQIFPNPFTSETTFKTNYLDFEKITIQVCDLYGKILICKVSLNSSSIVISKEGLKSGIYIIKMLYNNLVLSEDKLVVVEE